MNKINAGSDNSPPVANFFWDGPNLTLWSKACLNSFRNHGFDVSVYSYSDTLADELENEKIRVCDAGEILERSFRNKLINAASPESYGKTYACFSDFFRLKLLSKYPRTWWFDTDVFCLKPASMYKALELSCNGKAICGYQHPASSPVIKACNAILWFGDKSFAEHLYYTLEKTYPPFDRHEWKWAQTAIPYLNDAIKIHRERFDIQAREIFYPLSWLLDEIAIFMLPENTEEAQARCDNSLTLHFWNEIFTRHDISRNLLPPEGSFLNGLITENLAVEPATGLLEIGSLRQKLSG